MEQRNSCELPQRPYWPAWAAGLALGVVLLLTFVFTGHGLGATGFTTRLSAWLGDLAAPQWTLANDYLGPMVEDGSVLSSWITWQVVGVGVVVRVVLRCGGGGCGWRRFCGGDAAHGWSHGSDPHASSDSFDESIER